MVDFLQHLAIQEEFRDSIQKILFNEVPIVFKKTAPNPSGPGVLQESMLKSTALTASKVRPLISSSLSVSVTNLISPSSGRVFRIL